MFEFDKEKRGKEARGIETESNTNASEMRDKQKKVSTHTTSKHEYSIITLSNSLPPSMTIHVGLILPNIP